MKELRSSRNSKGKMLGGSFALRMRELRVERKQDPSNRVHSEHEGSQVRRWLWGQQGSASGEGQEWWSWMAGAHRIFRITVIMQSIYKG